MGAETALTSRAELAPGAAPGPAVAPEVAPAASATVGTPVTLLVMVGGRGLAADADLGRGTPLSGAAPNVFCTAHAVAVGAGLEPAVTQYFAPRHHCR
jgi:hypothetical protein